MDVLGRDLKALWEGPGLFWEKSWGSINSESYCENILPLMAIYANTRGASFNAG